MEDIIDHITLEQLKKVMKEHGQDLIFDEKREGHFLIRFTILDANCFVYYTQVSKNDNDIAVSEICLEAFFNDKGLITPEDINNINSGSSGDPVGKF